jgi:hypothetical protein
MRTGNTVVRDEVNTHLLDGIYIEVFPEGNVKDLKVTTNLHRLWKSYSKYPWRNGQSPLLIHKSAWDTL